MARHAGEARELLDASRPDLIILDVMLPRMDGFAFCRELRQEANYKDVPVIFVTGRDDIDSALNGFKSGAVDYIAKPLRISELRARIETHLKLKLSMDQIARQNDERRSLLRLLCHDLSNPVNFLVNALDLAGASPELLEGEREDLLRAARHCHEIIELARRLREIDEGSRKLSLESYRMEDLVHQALITLKPQFASKNIVVELDIEPDCEVMVEPSTFINSVLNNLLTNAVKFSFPGSSVRVRAWRKGEWGYVSVRDEGIGIPADVLETLFDMDFTASREGTAGEKGTGFGMPLARKFVEAYGGSIAAKPVDGPGAELEITLVAAPKDAERV